MRNSRKAAFMVECNNIEEMRKMSNYSNNRLTIANVEIAISGLYHYYVAKEGADVERAKLWMLKHINPVYWDLTAEEEFEAFKSRNKHVIREALLTAKAADIANERNQCIASLPAADTSRDLCA